MNLIRRLFHPRPTQPEHPTMRHWDKTGPHPRWDGATYKPEGNES